MPAILLLLVKIAIMYVISSLIAGTPKGAKPAGSSEFKMPTASEGRVIPILFGRKWFEGPNVVAYGKLRAEKIREWADKTMGKKVTVGYRYYMSFHLILSHCIDMFTKIKFGEKVVWPDPKNPETEDLTGATDIVVSARTAFGGKKREGGVSGDVTFQYGESTQTVDPHLTEWLGSDVPAYLYQSGAIFKDFYVGNNPYIRPISLLGRRYLVKTDGSAQWYPEKAEINGDMNPIHIIRECLTDSDWSIGEDGSSIGTSFTAAADTLYTEGFGLSYIWDNSVTLQEFIAEILVCIDAILYVNYSTNTYEIRLLREDYDPATLPSFDENDIESVEYDTKTITDVTNKVVVRYYNIDNPKEPKTVTAIEESLVERQGGKEIEKVMDFSGIVNDTLANKVAHREMRRETSMLPPMTIKGNRKLYSLNPGDPFKLTWAARGISDVVYRVVSIDIGKTRGQTVTVRAVKDLFNDGVATIDNNPYTAWVDQYSEPIDAANKIALESPYYILAKYLYDQSSANAMPTSSGRMLILGGRPVTMTYGFEMLVRDSAILGFYEDGDGSWTPTATLTNALPLSGSSATIDLSNVTDLSQVEANSVAMIDNELVLVTNVNADINQITISRGVLDTVPASHLAGARIWFLETVYNAASNEYSSGATPSAKILTIASEETLDESLATIFTASAFNSRSARPYPPGNFKIDGVSYPATFSGQPELTWNHRDRQKIDAVIAHDTASNYGPESGVTYTLEIYDDTNVLVRTESGLSGTSYTYSEANERLDCGLAPADPLNTQLRFKLWAVTSGGVRSLQSYDITVARV